MIKLLYLLGRIFICFIILIFLFISLLYWHTRIYDFEKLEPFRGTEIYNPYHQIEDYKPYKANFHAHSKAWGGLSNGHNTPEVLYKAYKQKGYTLASISNYHKIEKTSDISVYEHGFNFQKSHKLALFASEVSFIDFPIFQTTSHKQTIVDILKEKGSLVAIAHPAFWNGTTIEDFKFLSNYSFIEVLNHYRISDKHWDSALSSGRLIWLISDDDTHDIDREATFVMWTVILAPDSSLKTLKKNMLLGQMYGVHGKNTMTTNALLESEVKGVTISMIFKEKAKKIILIGQNGQIKKKVLKSDNVHYNFLEEDTYIRAVIENKDGSKLYLNPFVRYDGKQPPCNNLNKSSVNIFKTHVFRLIIILIDIGLIILGLKCI